MPVEMEPLPTDKRVSTGRGQAELAARFIRATARYWLGVFPYVKEEFRRWRERAAGIPDPTLRRMALETHREKRENLNGAAAFAAFVPPRSRGLVVRAAIAYQIAFDYIDTITEQSDAEPIANGLQLNQSLLTALEVGVPHPDYYSQQSSRGDNGYLVDLIDTFRRSASALPSYGAIVRPVRQFAKQIICYQSFNHGDARGSFDAFVRWARSETDPSTGLHWWETAASAGSTLPMFALLAAAATPTTTERHTAALMSTYVPWIAALSTLLDNLIDHQDDIASGQHNLVSYYSSEEQAASRLQMIATESMRRARALPDADHHSMLLAAMASFFHSPRASEPSVRLTTQRVLDAMGDFAGPTLFVLGARRRTVAFTASLPDAAARLGQIR